MISLDEELRRKVIDHLSWDNRIHASEVNVEVQGGKVILSGTVHTLIEKLLVEKDAQIIPGVKTVENLLQVRYPQDMPGISDKEIKETVIYMLNHTASLKARDIKVEVNNGMVTLEGTVRSFWERMKAEDIADDVMGVVEVDNQLVVAMPEVTPDSIIEADIREALKRTYAVDPDAIQIKANKGTVSLTGTVPTWGLYFDVENIAKYTHGVKDVRNNLTVE